MDNLQSSGVLGANAPSFDASVQTRARKWRRFIPVFWNGSRLLGFALSALAFAILLAGCGQEAAKPVAETAAKPAEPAVPEEIQTAAQTLLGNETQVLLFGDLARTGNLQFLAANVVPKTPKNDAPGTIVTRAVVAEKNEGKWTEVLRCDEHLKNPKGFLGLTPIGAIAGWRVQYEQYPVKGLQIYFTPLKINGDTHVLPIGVGWNPQTKRYQSLDRSYEHFLMESPALETPRSVLR